MLHCMRKNCGKKNIQQVYLGIFTFSLFAVQNNRNVCKANYEGNLCCHNIKIFFTGPLKHGQSKVQTLS